MSGRFPCTYCFFIFYHILLLVAPNSSLVSFGEDEELINPKFFKNSLLLREFVSLTSELILVIACRTL